MDLNWKKGVVILVVALIAFNPSATKSGMAGSLVFGAAGGYVLYEAAAWLLEGEEETEEAAPE